MINEGFIAHPCIINLGSLEIKTYMEIKIMKKTYFSSNTLTLDKNWQNFQPRKIYFLF